MDTTIESTKGHRMLGSVTEADDAVQDTWLRYRQADTGDVQNLGGWLTTVVSRICLNVLRALGARQDHLAGAHVPDPVGPGPGDGGRAGRYGRPGHAGRARGSRSTSRSLPVPATTPSPRLSVPRRAVALVLLLFVMRRWRRSPQWLAEASAGCSSLSWSKADSCAGRLAACSGAVSGASFFPWSACPVPASSCPA